jgi:hypothetical protein
MYSSLCAAFPGTNFGDPPRQPAAAAAAGDQQQEDVVRVQVFQRWDFDLQDLMHCHPDELDLLMVVSILQQLSRTLLHLEAVTVVVGGEERTIEIAQNDIKQSNLLMQRLQIGPYVLWLEGVTDFGVAKVAGGLQYRMLGTKDFRGMELDGDQMKELQQLLPQQQEVPAGQAGIQAPVPCATPAAHAGAPSAADVACPKAPDSPRTAAARHAVRWGSSHPLFDWWGYIEVAEALLKLLNDVGMRRQQAMFRAAAAAAAGGGGGGGVQATPNAAAAAVVYATCQHLVAALAQGLKDLRGLISQFRWAQTKTFICQHVRETHLQQCKAPVSKLLEVAAQRQKAATKAAEAQEAAAAEAAAAEGAAAKEAALARAAAAAEARATAEAAAAEAAAIAKAAADKQAAEDEATWAAFVAAAGAAAQVYQQMGLEELKQLAAEQRNYDPSSMPELFSMMQDFERRFKAKRGAIIQLLADIMAANPDQELKRYYSELSECRVPAGEEGGKGFGRARGTLAVQVRRGQA